VQTLNRQMIESHVRKANKMFICCVDNTSVIKQLHELALEANPRRATPCYISLIMTHDDYLGRKDGLNSAPHARNVLRRDNIFCGKYNTPKKNIDYFEKKARKINNDYLLGFLV